MGVAAAAALAPYVRSMSVYDITGPPGVHLGLPSTQVSVVLPVDDPLDVAWSGDPGSRQRSWQSVSGLHTRPAHIRHGGRMAGVCLGLTPAGARALLGVPAGALAGTLVELDDVDRSFRTLPERLATTPSSGWGAAVGRALLEALERREARAPRAEVGRALALLTRGAAVSAVASDVGLTRRHLGELVRVETGVTPQRWRQLARFQRSQPMVAAGRRLADVAAACGYADQAHLAREWRELAGCSPTAWRRQELPIVQDMAASRQQDGEA